MFFGLCLMFLVQVGPFFSWGVTLNITYDRLMKIARLITNVAVVGESEGSWTIVDVFANPGHVCGQRAILWSRNAILGPKPPTYYPLIMMELLFVDVITIGSSDK